MNRSRYEPVPQQEPIILSPINTASYNYNTALPNSVAPSAPSIPSSPPPSFRSSQSVNDDIDCSPGTPRAAEHANVRNWNNHTPTAIVGETSGSDAQFQIAALKSRVERLEECIGQLMLDKETTSSSSAPRSNCCVTFTDASGDIERDFSRRGGSNCCVTFKRGPQTQWKHMKPQLILLSIGIFVILLVAVVNIGKCQQCK
ncbi:hypothetical protein B7463_g6122, partial [Scytalidium lignicola]